MTQQMQQSSLDAKPDRSAAGLQFQRYQLGLKATGAALGQGLRTTPDPNSGFSHPISRSQFRGSGYANQSVGEEEQNGL